MFLAYHIKYQFQKGFHERFLRKTRKIYVETDMSDYLHLGSDQDRIDVNSLQMLKLNIVRCYLAAQIPEITAARHLVHFAILLIKIKVYYIHSGKKEKD
jgi:hypothetical protein